MIDSIDFQNIEKEKYKEIGNLLLDYVLENNMYMEVEDKDFFVRDGDEAGVHVFYDGDKSKLRINISGEKTEKINDLENKLRDLINNK